METWRSVEKNIPSISFENLRSRYSRDLKVFKRKDSMLFSMDLHVSMVISWRECGVI